MEVYTCIFIYHSVTLMYFVHAALYLSDVKFGVPPWLAADLNHLSSEVAVNHF